MQPPQELVKSEEDQKIWQAAVQKAHEAGRPQDMEFAAKLFKKIKQQMMGQQKQQPQQVAKGGGEQKSKSKSKSPEDNKKPEKKDGDDGGGDKDKKKQKDDDKKKDKEKEGSIPRDKVAAVFKQAALYIEELEKENQKLRDKNESIVNTVNTKKAKKLAHIYEQKTGEEAPMEAMEKLAKVGDESLMEVIQNLAGSDKNNSLGSPSNNPTNEKTGSSKEDAITKAAEDEADEQFLRWVFD